jgi:anti-sigma factor RsiW
MSREISHEKLIAFALGELKGEEAKDVERFIASDSKARQHVHEVRELARFSERDLKAEPLAPGRGSAPIFAEIAKRNAERPTARRVWLQAASLGVVIVLFTLAFPLRHQFSGNVAKLFGLPERATEVATEDRPTHRKAKEDPGAVTDDLAEFQARARAGISAGPCRIALPAITAADSVVTGKDTATATYLLPGTGLRLEIIATARLAPLVHGSGVEGKSQVNGFEIFRHVQGVSRTVYFAVPESQNIFYCELEAGTTWTPPEDLAAAFGAALDDLSHSLAQGFRLGN